MAIRYEDATKLYQQTLKEISQDEMRWSAFLKSACRNYRLTFADMVMIYAQRPDATAVLEIEEWNKRGSNLNQKGLQYLIQTIIIMQD